MDVFESSLSPVDAFQSISRFARLRGREPLFLAMHAAVPEGFHVEMLPLLRRNFLPDVDGDTDVDADVVLSPLCQDLGAGYFRFDPEVRRILVENLQEAYPSEGGHRIERVAGFLLAYVEHKRSRSHARDDLLLDAYLEAQKWTALAFLDPESAAEQLATALDMATEAEGSHVRLGNVASVLSLPLNRYKNLMDYARGVESLQSGDAAAARYHLERIGDRQIQAGSVTLGSAAELLERARATEPAPGAAQSQATPDEGSDRAVRVLGDDEAWLSPAFDNDIFISFVHGDEESANWTFGVMRDLLSRIKTMSSDIETIKVHPDGSAFEASDWLPTVDRIIERAALFVIVMSGPYLDSDFCRHELAQIVRHVQADKNGTARLILVETAPVPYDGQGQDWKRDLASQLGREDIKSFEFYSRSESDGSSTPLGWPVPSRDDDAYNAAVDQLARYVSDRLHQAYVRLSATGEQIRSKQRLPKIEWPPSNHTFDIVIANRTAEMSFIQSALSGRTRERVILVSGAAGVGKSALLRRIGAYADNVGIRATRVKLDLSSGFGDIFDALDPDTNWPVEEVPEPSDLAVLTMHLSWEIRSRPDPVLLILDNFEQAPTHLRDWIGDRFLRAVPDMRVVVAVIAGREVPDTDDPQLDSIARKWELGPIEDPEPWQEFAHSSHGVKLDTDEVKTLIDQADGDMAKMTSLIASYSQQAQIPTPRWPGLDWRDPKVLAEALVKSPIIGRSMRRFLDGDDGTTLSTGRGMAMIMLSDDRLPSFEADKKLAAYESSNHLFADILAGNDDINPVIIWLAESNPEGCTYRFASQPMPHHVLQCGPSYTLEQMFVALARALEYEGISLVVPWLIQQLRRDFDIDLRALSDDCAAVFRNIDPPLEKILQQARSVIRPGTINWLVENSSNELDLNVVAEILELKDYNIARTDARKTILISRGDSYASEELSFDAYIEKFFQGPPVWTLISIANAYLGENWMPLLSAAESAPPDWGGLIVLVDREVFEEEMFSAIVNESHVVFGVDAHFFGAAS